MVLKSCHSASQPSFDRKAICPAWMGYLLGVFPSSCSNQLDLHHLHRHLLKNGTPLVGWTLLGQQDGFLFGILGSTQQNYLWLLVR